MLVRGRIAQSTRTSHAFAPAGPRQYLPVSRLPQLFTRAGSSRRKHQIKMEERKQQQEQDLASLLPAELIARINDLEARLKTTTARLAEFTGVKANTTETTVTSTTQDGASVTGLGAQVKMKVKKTPRPIDFSRYSTRHIVLKFSYLGHRYNGIEHTNGGTAPLRPTIEEVLWKALRKSRLIPTEVPEGCDSDFDVVYDERSRKEKYRDGQMKLEIDWSSLEYSKCGRTDKGVSAFGQVVALNVRSNRPKPKMQRTVDETVEDAEVEEKQIEFDDVRDEIPYISVLNAILPTDIRILAWCPDHDGNFSARLMCKERRYKYFFTNPAFCPTPGPWGLSHADGTSAPVREGWLDIEAMGKAAKKLEGLHDFRNFCKIDASKQMSSCQRRITFTSIEEFSQGTNLNRFSTDPNLRQGSGITDIVSDTMRSPDLQNGNQLGTDGPKVYTFTVHGTAFLWHQVRCMAAILFLVGQGLEQPDVVDKLLNITDTPRKPHYEMADHAPLVLWDCVFPGSDPDVEDGLKWIYAGDEASLSPFARKGDSLYDSKFGLGGIVSELWTEWREAKLKETLNAGLLSLALQQGDGSSLERSGIRIGADPQVRGQRIFQGGDTGKTVGDYVPVMHRETFDTLEVQNAKYLNGKQARRDAKAAQRLSDK